MSAPTVADTFTDPHRTRIGLLVTARPVPGCRWVQHPSSGSAHHGTLELTTGPLHVAPASLFPDYRGCVVRWTFTPAT